MMARLKRLVRRIRRAGLDPKLTPHDLRHTRASWHYAPNRDLLALALKQEGAGRVSRR
jgi:integrase